VSVDAEPGPHGPIPASLLAMLLGLALVVVGAFLPWVRSGDSTRSSFAMVRSADRLGIVDDGIGLVVLRGWYLVPLVAASVVVLLTLHRLRAAAIVGLVLAGIVAATSGLVVLAAPDTGPGPFVCLAGALVAVGASIGLLRAPRRGSIDPDHVPHA
jgi:hypothetical protein